MTFGRQITFWVAALGVLLALIWLLHEILLPFVAGMVLAYLLDPVASRIERIGINRFFATLTIVGLFIFAFVVLVILVAPIVISQLLELIDRLPGYVARLQELIADSNRPWLTKIVGDSIGSVELTTMMKQGTGGLTIFLRSLWSGGQALASIFSLLVITPVVAFYLLNDWHRLVATIDNWLPRDHADAIRRLASDINTAIAGFVRGQSAVCLILGLFYALGLTIIGLKFGFVIGLIAGLISFVPYVGTLTAFVVSVGVAIAQAWPDWTLLAAAVGVNLVGQVLEGYILAPYLVGQSVGLHPVWLMFALLAFGYLFGFVGLLVAIPLAAAVAVVVRFALRKYLSSPFYTGKHPH
ncbi:MAG: AI-2E family transporter [Proteobacteria bacterium]|nr:AI-2E family transporter [Pseudomonadota bacterium]